MLSESAAALIAVVIRRIRPSFRLIDRDKSRSARFAPCVVVVSSSSPPVCKSGLTGTHVDPRNRSGDRTRTGLRAPARRAKNTVAGWRGGGFVPHADTWRHETDSAAPLQRRTDGPLCR